MSNAPFEAFRLDSTIDEEVFQASIRRAPYYGSQISRAIKRAIRAIHGVKRVYARYPMFGVCVYLGRSGQDLAANRLRTHGRSDKQLLFGGPVFTCDTDRAARLETLAIRVFEWLDNAESLCVQSANIAKHGEASCRLTSVPLSI